MKLSVLIPVFNERLYLKEIFTRVVLCPLTAGNEITDLELVVVDDCSTDGTREWLNTRLKEFESLRQRERADGVRVEIKLLLQPENAGKGSAIQRAMKESTGDLVLIQDADLEYTPNDYPRLLQPIVDGKADAVFGSRFLGEQRRVLFFWHSMLNKLLTMFSNMVSDLNLTDMETCYKAMKGSVARSVRLTSKRFGIEPELTARLAQMRVRIYEVPIQYHGRTYEEGKKIGVWDGAAALWHIIKFNFLDREPIREGMTQTLLALSDGSAVFYRPQLIRALTHAGLVERRDLQILEVGSGIGTITQSLLKFGNVTASDIDPQYVSHLKKRFGFCESFKALEWDTSKTPPTEVESKKYDLIVAFNILEHIEDDIGTLRAWRSLLKDEGSLIVLVPWSQRLFSPIDKAIGHYRRYSEKGLEQTLNRGGFYKKKLLRDNPLGILGWFLNGVLLRKSSLPSGQVSIYAKIKPVIGPFEKVLSRFVGLNLVVVAASTSAKTSEVQDSK